jgi:hypothetical protein
VGKTTCNEGAKESCASKPRRVGTVVGERVDDGPGSDGSIGIHFIARSAPGSIRRADALLPTPRPTAVMFTVDISCAERSGKSRLNIHISAVVRCALFRAAFDGSSLANINIGSGALHKIGAQRKKVL